MPRARSTPAASSKSSTGPTTAPDSSSGNGTSTGAATGSTTSTIPADPACGDGNTVPGEDCDDANKVDSDGCNTDCHESGSVVWAETLPHTPGVTTDTLNAVVVLEDGRILAGGSRFVDGDGGFQGEANLVQLSPNGDLEHEVAVVTTERDDSVRGLAIDAMGRISSSPPLRLREASRMSPMTTCKASARSPRRRYLPGSSVADARVAARRWRPCADPGARRRERDHLRASRRP